MLHICITVHGAKIILKKHKVTSPRDCVGDTKLVLKIATRWLYCETTYLGTFVQIKF